MNERLKNRLEMQLIEMETDTEEVEAAMARAEAANLKLRADLEEADDADE